MSATSTDESRQRSPTGLDEWPSPKSAANASASRYASERVRANSGEFTANACDSARARLRRRGLVRRARRAAARAAARPGRARERGRGRARALALHALGRVEREQLVERPSGARARVVEAEELALERARTRASRSTGATEMGARRLASGSTCSMSSRWNAASVCAPSRGSRRRRGAGRGAGRAAAARPRPRARRRREPARSARGS